MSQSMDSNILSLQGFSVNEDDLLIVYNGSKHVSKLIGIIIDNYQCGFAFLVYFTLGLSNNNCHYLLTWGQNCPTVYTNQTKWLIARSKSLSHSAYISSIVSAYICDTTDLFSFSVGDNSPPSTEKSFLRTLNFFILATLEIALLLALSIPSCMASSTLDHSGLDIASDTVVNSFPQTLLIQTRVLSSKFSVGIWVWRSTST